MVRKLSPNEDSNMWAGMSFNVIKAIGLFHKKYIHISNYILLSYKSPLKLKQFKNLINSWNGTNAQYSQRHTVINHGDRHFTHLGEMAITLFCLVYCPNFFCM